MNEYLHHTFMNIITGTYGWAGWLTITCNIFIPQLLWFKQVPRQLLLDDPRGRRR